MIRRALFMVKLVLVLLTALSRASLVLAAEPYASITSEELKKMLTQKPSEVVVMDTRSPAEYAEAHIEGALNLPFPRMEADPALPDLPKDTPLVFYCTGYS